MTRVTPRVSQVRGARGTGADSHLGPLPGAAPGRATLGGSLPVRGQEPKGLYPGHGVKDPSPETPLLTFLSAPLFPVRTEFPLPFGNASPGKCKSLPASALASSRVLAFLWGDCGSRETPWKPLQWLSRFTPETTEAQRDCVISPQMQSMWQKPGLGRRFLPSGGVLSPHDCSVYTRNFQRCSER